MARQPIDLPSQSSGAGRVRFSAPQRVPGLPAEAQRALLDAFQAIQQELFRLSSPFTRVPLIDSVQELRDGQVVRGVGDGNTLVLPGPPAYQGIRVVLDDVSSAITVVAPDATEYVLPVAGVYDFLPASDDGETYETTPLFSLLNVTSGVVLGRETAGTGPVEELSVGGGLELNSGLQIADNGVALGKLVGAPNQGFVGSTGLGDYEHLTAATVAAAFTSTSIVNVGVELQRAAVTGDVSIPQNSNTATIPAGTVENSQTADMAESRVKGRPVGAGTGPQQDMTPAQTAAIVSPELPGRLIAVTAYTTAASGTHTFDSDATSAEIWVIGGGGGGGGANGALIFGGGGGAGALNYCYVPAGSLPASASYTVGAAGAAGGPTTAGGAGGASSVTVSASVHSGGGGGGGGPGATPTPGAGGTGTGGTFTVFTVNGGGGQYGQLQPGGQSGGNGGNSAFGGGARGPTNAAGAAGDKGGGGSGGAALAGSFGGGAGGAGLIIVKEYA